MFPDVFASHIHSHHFQNAQRHLQFFLFSGAVCGHDLLCRFVGGFQWMIFKTRGCVVAVLLVATLLLPRTQLPHTHPNALKTSRSPDLKGQLTCSPRNYGKKAKFEKLKENTFLGFVTFTVGSLGGVGVSGLEKCFSTLPERITSPFPSRHGLESMN